MLMVVIDYLIRKILTKSKYVVKTHSSLLVHRLSIKYLNHPPG